MAIEPDILEADRHQANRFWDQLIDQNNRRILFSILFYDIA